MSSANSDNYHNGGDNDKHRNDNSGGDDDSRRANYDDGNNYYSVSSAACTLLLPLLLRRDVITADVIVHRLWRQVASWRGAVCCSAAAITDNDHSIYRTQLWGAAETRRQQVRGATGFYRRVFGEGTVDRDAGFHFSEWKDRFRFHRFWIYPRLQLQRHSLQFGDVSVKCYRTSRFNVDFITARRSYASAVLGVVILSVCKSVRLSVCLSHACFVTNPKNLRATFLYRMKGQCFRFSVTQQWLVGDVPFHLK